MKRRRIETRRGVTPAEVVIVAAIAGLVGLVVLMALPRSRETARLAGCERNLKNIGQVVAYYDQAVGHLPAVPARGESGHGPLADLLGQFGLGNLREVETTDPKTFEARSGKAREQASAHFVVEFVCPSDPNGRRRHFVAPVSYRGNAGPGTDGTGGPFSFGKIATIAQAERAAGSEYTAAFAERLIGGGPNPSSSIEDYMRLPGPIDAAGCPPGPPDTWRGDAGSSWLAADWTSSLYNHALPPNASPSCLAEDGRTARMGASSAHSGRVNVLMLGGSVRAFTTDVDPEVWRKFGGLDMTNR